jgi:hypothetical protein
VKEEEEEEEELAPVLFVAFPTWLATYFRWWPTDVVEFFPELTLEVLDSSNKQQYDKPFYNSGGQRPNGCCQEREREREREGPTKRGERRDTDRRRERERRGGGREGNEIRIKYV